MWILGVLCSVLCLSEKIRGTWLFRLRWDSCLDYFSSHFTRGLAKDGLDSEHLEKFICPLLRTVDVLVGSSAEICEGWKSFYPSSCISSLFLYFCGMSSGCFFFPLCWTGNLSKKNSARRTNTVTFHGLVSAALSTCGKQHPLLSRWWEERKWNKWNVFG